MFFKLFIEMINYKVLLGTILCLTLSFDSQAQCPHDFTYKSYPTEKGMKTGRIEISTNNWINDCLVKVFKIEGKPELLKREEMTFKDKMISIENLEATDYIVKIEWGGNCSFAVGGISGIRVDEKTN